MQSSVRNRTISLTSCSSAFQEIRPLLLPRKIVEAALVVLVIGAGFAIRMLYLDARPLWVDEAESSINALTILQRGYPADIYLGLPIYENTLVRSWPESAEYEYRDLSYSDRHFAVYHGWLPLYSIAGSFALYGVQPDEADQSRRVKHDLADRKRRTRAARLPGVVFGTAFLLIAFAGGRILYGRDAAWAALIVGSIYPWHLYLSRQARYYSLQITLTTACCIMLWLLLTQCRWRHIYLSALAFVLLFHTHILSFCTCAAVGLLIAPFIVRGHRRAIRKLGVLAALVASGILPWVILTGFQSQLGRIPRAWSMLDIPLDLLQYPPLRMTYALPGLLVVLLAAWVMLYKSHLPEGFSAPFLRLAPVLVFLGIWIACSYAMVVGFMPAVSFATNRLNLVYWGPMFLLASAICASLARVVTPAYTVVTAPVLMLLMFFLTGHELDLKAPFSSRSWASDTGVFDRLDAMHLNGSTRLYAAPNDHLIFSFYSGLPVQSIAPVRKSFLDSYPGDIVFIDTAISVDTEVLVPERIRQEALRNGQSLSPEDNERWTLLLRTRDYRAAMLKTVEPCPSTELEHLPPFAEKLLIEQGKQLAPAFANSGLDLMTRGFDIHTWSDWRAVLMYRFVDPSAHRGALANYAQRLRGAEAMILSSDSALYRSKWHPSEVCEGMSFQFVH